MADAPDDLDDKLRPEYDLKQLKPVPPERSHWRRRMQAAKQPEAQQQPKLLDLPNVGPKMVAKLNRLGIFLPEQLRGRDPYALFQRLCELRGPTDPCVLDTFIALVRYLDDGIPRHWWHFTAERKRTIRERATQERKQTQ